MADAAAAPRPRGRLPPEVNRILYVRNLPFNTTGDEIYSLFGKYGAIRQVRLGTTKQTRGTAYVVYEDIYDAKAAADHLSGFNVGGRYLIVLYFSEKRQRNKMALKEEEEALKKLQKEHGVDGSQRGRG